MRPTNFAFLDTGGLSAFESRTTDLQDPRPHPTEAALSQLGSAIMTETLDLLLETALEDHVGVISETLIGGLHSGVQRLEREADRARDALAQQLRDFDGSEVADGDLQAAKRTAEALDVAVQALEFVRDAAACAYTSATGEVWSPWRGNVRGSRTTAAQIEAKAALRAVRDRRQAACDPGQAVVAFRAAPTANSPSDAGRIFDALNWARSQWPDMALATTGAAGGEQLAKRWAVQKGVKVILARADFDRHGRAAPFRANDELMQLEPVCVLTLAASLEPGLGEVRPFGPALNLAQEAHEAGVRCVRIGRRAMAGP
ncbi:MAG TPA: DUF2493 domain-containing protein [Phenylobacterium sp.]|jgi:hypothetical protein